MSQTNAEVDPVRAAFSRDASARGERVSRAVAELRVTTGEPARRAMDTLAFEAHGLRGAASTVGLDELSDAAGKLEELVARWDPDEPETHEAILSAAGRLLDLVHAAAAPAHSIVLHVEDNESNLKLVERILDARPSVQLEEARTAADGLELATRLHPALILLDLRLPDASGEWLLERLKERPETSGIAVVVVSAEARPAEADRLLALGADDFLVKPIDVRTLLRLVDGILARASS